MFILILALVSGLVFAAGAAEDKAAEKVYEATFAHVVRPTIAKGRAADMFADLVRERSGGRIDISVYPDSLLGTDREITEQMQLGDIQFNAPFTGVLPAFVPQTQLFDLPFAFRDSQGVYDAMYGPVGDILAPYLLQQGLRVLGYWDGGFKSITNNTRPIHSPADLRGMRIRVSQSPLLISQFAAMNSSGVDIAFAELYTALQQGTVDGQENSLANIYTRRFYEAQKYMTVTEHGYLGYIFLVAEDFYQSLPADLRKIIDETADEVSDWQWIEARIEDNEYLEQLRQTDMEVVDLTPAQKQAFRDATASVYDVFVDSVKDGDKLIEALRKSQ
ncbi:MAG TPA: DctP family TRAP transporter solute-binding subunit [Sphaerochaeta sp.]|nr:DctP family TRAP transporter solute-binding subunit [Sphaerochaeta sp.]